MLIDRNNYEGYFLDFLEGSLTEQEIDEILAFLKNNPDLEDDLLHFDKYVIESNQEISINKNFLFKSLDSFHSVNENNFDEFCVAWYEKDLSPASQEELSKYLVSHPEKIRDFENYGRVQLTAPSNIRYPYKSRLRKFTLSPFYKLAYISSAAAAILLIVLYLIPFNKQIGPSSKQTIAVHQLNNNSKIQNPDNNKGLSSAKVLQSTETKKHKYPASVTNNEIGFLTDIGKDSIPKEMINLMSLNSIKINYLKPDVSNEKLSFPSVPEKNNSKNITPSYQTIKEFALRRLRKNIDKSQSFNEVGDDFSLWDLAQLGVTGINKFTGSEIKLDRKINDEGKMVAMAIESGKLGFSRSVNK